MPIRCLGRPSRSDGPCARAAPSGPMSFGTYMLASPSPDRLFGIRQTVVRAVWPGLSARPRRPVLLMGNGTGGFLEFLGGDCGLLGDSCGRPELPRLQENMKRVEGLAPAPQGRAAGRRHQDGSGGGRYVPLHPFIQQVQLLRRPGKKDEPVVGDGGRVEFRARDRTVASRLQARPPQPVARRDCRAWAEPEPVQGPDPFFSPASSSRQPLITARAHQGLSATHFKVASQRS